MISGSQVCTVKMPERNMICRGTRVLHMPNTKATGPHLDVSRIELEHVHAGLCIAHTRLEATVTYQVCVYQRYCIADAADVASIKGLGQALRIKFLRQSMCKTHMHGRVSQSSYF